MNQVMKEQRARRSRWTLAVMICAGLMSDPTDVSAQTPLGSEWTYQGEVTLSGSPLTGSADLKISIWDHKTVGNMIGPMIAKNNVAVTDGRFTVELDSGVQVFNGDRRWLQIAVRSPAGGGAFTTLSPRQPLTAAPYAEYAKNGSLWNTVGTTMHYDGGFVGVGLSAPVTGADVFSIHKPGTGYGGMYASTDSGGRPFYGYSAGSEVGWHYLDANGDWHLYLDGEKLSVTDEGNVGIGLTDPNYALEILTATNRGVSAETTNSNTGASALFGHATAPAGTTYGVYGITNSEAGAGVFGVALDSFGVNHGVLGATFSSSGFDFFATGLGVNYGASSSIRWKNNVEAISQPLDKISKLRGVSFDWDTAHGGQHDIGLIAEEVGKVLPEIVRYESNGVDAIGLDYSKLTPLLVEAVNALRDEKDDQIEALRLENETMKSRLIALEELMQQPKADEGQR